MTSDHQIALQMASEELETALLEHERAASRLSRARAKLFTLISKSALVDDAQDNQTACPAVSLEAR